MRYHEGNACVLRAVRTIEAGEEITDNYCIHFSDVPAAERRDWIEVESGDEMRRYDD